MDITTVKPEKVSLGYGENFGRFGRGTIHRWKGWLRRSDWNDLQTFLVFLGYPRSAHSIVGAMIDGHPECLVAHELHCLKYVERGVGRNALFSLLCEQSRWFTKLGCEWTGYSYRLQGQSQGTWDGKLKVIGDKKGGGSSLLLNQKPELLDRLAAIVGMELSLIHVVRNPFDTVTTMARKSGKTAAQVMKGYLRMARTVDRIRSEGVHSFHTLYLDDLTSDPEGELQKIEGFLRISHDSEWVEACRGLLYEKPNRRPREGIWTEESMAEFTDQLRVLPDFARFVEVNP